MMYLLWALVVLLGLFFPKNKIITILQMLYIWIAIGYCSWAPDFWSNEFMYNNVDSGLYTLYEPLFVNLIRLCRNFGFDFTEFRCVVATLMLVVLYFALRKRVIQKNVVLSTLIVYPILSFASGLRSAIPFAIIIYAALQFVFDNNDKSRKVVIRYVILIIIATLFHYSFIVFLLLLLLKKRFNINRMFRILTAETVVIIMWRIGLLYLIIGRFVHSQKVLLWLNYNSYNHPGILLDFVMVALVFGTVYFLSKTAKWNYELNEGRNLAIKNCCLFMVMFLPALFMSVTFERYETVFLALNIIFIVDKYSVRSIKKFMYPAIGLIYNFAFYFFIHGNIFFPMLYSNMLIK